MSDEEIFFDDGNDEEDDDNEHDAHIKEELIALVKANPALYTKNSKEYAGKNFSKDLAWESIGFSLSKQLSGKDAAKMWYNIRQRFGKERRKVVAAVKGKSGQQTKPLYVPKWPLYPLCLFLADHIMPRKTVSNYMSCTNVKKTTTVGKTKFSPVFILPSPSPSSSSSSSFSPLASRSTPSPETPSSQVMFVEASFPQAPWLQTPLPQASPLQAPSPDASWSQASSPQVRPLQASSPQARPPQAASPQTPSPQASVFLSPSSVWSSDLESTCSNDSVSSIQDSKRNEATIHASTSSSSGLNVKECSFASVTAVPPPEEVRKAIQKVSTKRTIPELDQFAKRRKKDDHLFMQAIATQSAALSSFATKLNESFVSQQGQCTSQANVSISSSALPVDDPVLIAIGYAFKSVPQEKRLECMLDVLNVIKSKYVK